MRLKSQKRAFTLIELLFVILVAGIVLAVAIPRIRIVSKERGVRETSRIVGSIISKASDEAVINGAAGIVIRRNPNFFSGTQWYASTQLGILRAVPVYVGDQPYARGATPSRGANRISPTLVEVPRPIEQDDNPPIVPGDRISFNYSPVQFEINNVATVVNGQGRSVLRLQLNANAGSYPSIAPEFEDVPYVVHRQPVLRQSSLQELPEGFIIDLRFSGFDIVFESLIEDPDTPFENYDIEIIFDEFGYVAKALYKEVDANNVRTGRFVRRIPNEPIYFLVTEIPDSPQRSPLANDLAMWVAIKLQSTSPFVGYNVPQRENFVAGVFIPFEVPRARGIATQGAAP